MAPNFTRRLLALGIACPAVFWTTTFVCGAVHGAYDHVSGTISELGALGSRSQHLFSALIGGMSIVGGGFCVGLHRVCGGKNLSVLPLIPVFVFFLGNGGVALCPLGTRLHPVMGQITVAVMLSPALACWYWRAVVPRHVSLAAVAIFVAAVAVLLSGLVPDSYVQRHEGLVQRIFHAGWTFWFIALGTHFNGGERVPAPVKRGA